MNIREYGISLISKISQERFFQYYKELERNQWLKKDEIIQRQLTKLKNLLNYAVENINFYQERFRNFNIKDFKSLNDIKRLPILTKDELKEAGEEAVAGHRKKLISKSTSGTTGPPFNFVVDRDFFSLEIARNQRIFDLPGVVMGEPWILFTPLRGRKSSIFSYLNNRLVLDANQISVERTPPCCPSSVKNRLEPDENMIRQFCARIKKHKPRMIYSYPSSLIGLATFIRKWGIAGIKIKTIISSGEVLTSETRNLIEETFGGEVFNLYGTTEFPTIAEECKEHNGLHIFTDSYIVEFVNNGEIVITDLDNYTMPFIRYQTGDLGFLKNGQCKCGRNLPLMEIIQGRKSDLIITPDGKFLRRSFFSSLFKKNSEIEKFDVFQNEQGKIMISIMLGKQLPESRKDFLVRRCWDYAGDSININIVNSPNSAQ
jgi:phenylacetate-coenzyme A ligase PaaK-like adenylate-forming protein